MVGEGAWIIERRRAPAADLHSADLLAPPVGRRVVWMEAERPALVIGSSQRADTVDVAACARAGVEVVRRRSGGGAVLVAADDVAWVDVVVPAGDPLADEDVGRAMWWLGDVWVETLARLGIGGATTHRGSLVSTEWSPTICFAGLGAGEVMLEDAKLVGISQRRTRLGARFQCAVHRAWHPERLVELLTPPRPAVSALPPVATVSAPLDAIRTAFAAAVVVAPR